MKIVIIIPSPKEIKMKQAYVEALTSSIEDCYWLVQILQSLDNDALKLIVTQVLSDVKSKINTSTNPKRHVLSSWILRTALYFLNDVTLQNLIKKLQEREIHEFRAWLLVDAILTRGVIYECFGDLENSLNNYNMLINELFKYVLIDEENERSVDKSEGNLQILVPISVRQVVIAAAIRVANLQANYGTTAEAVDAVGRCVVIPSLFRKNPGEDVQIVTTEAKLNSKLSVKIQLGLLVQIALVFLNHASFLTDSAPNRDQSSVIDSIPSDLSSKHINDTHNDKIASTINVAYNILQKTQETIQPLPNEVPSTILQNIKSTATGADVKIFPSEDYLDLNPLNLSMVCYMPVVQSDHLHLEQTPCASLISLILYAMKKFRDRDFELESDQVDETVSSKGDNPENLHICRFKQQQYLRCLQWGLSIDTDVDMDTTYALGMVYEEIGLYEEALSLMIQSYHVATKQFYAKKSYSHDNFTDAPSHRGLTLLGVTMKETVLQWLGFPTLPSSYPVVPIFHSINICLNSMINDPFRALQLARLCFVDHYKDIAVEFMKVIGTYECDVSYEHHAQSFDPVKGLDERFKNNDLQTTKLADVASNLYEAKELRSLYRLVQLLAQCHVICGLVSHNGNDFHKCLHFRVAARAYGSLYQSFFQDDMSVSQHTGKDTYTSTVDFDMYDKGNQNEEFILYYAVVLCELGEVSAAMTIVRQSIAAVGYQNNSRLLHLLALMVCCPISADDVRVYSAAISICQHSLDYSDDPNARLTLALLEAKVNINGVPTTKTLEKLSSTIDDVKRVEALLWQQYASHNNINTNEPLKKDQRAHDTPDTDYVNRQLFPGNPLRSNDRRWSSPNYIQAHTNFLVLCNTLYRSSMHMSEAKACLGNAWKFLFFPRDPYPRSYVNASQEAKIPSCKASSRISRLRQVPTLLGWHIAEATGWGFLEDFGTVVLPLQAGILSEAASIVRYEFSSSKLSKQSAIELYEIALATSASCDSALIAMAEIELARAGFHCDVDNLIEELNPKPQEASRKRGNYDSNIFMHLLNAEQITTSTPRIEKFKSVSSTDEASNEGKSPINSNSNDDSVILSNRVLHANDLAVRAVRHHELNPNAWRIYSRCLYIQKKYQESAVASLTGLQCMKYISVRPFHHVLWDGYLLPSGQVGNISHLRK
jgi:tetratricopeptide (TPR) repeat protein